MTTPRTARPPTGFRENIFPGEDVGQGMYAELHWIDERERMRGPSGVQVFGKSRQVSPWFVRYVLSPPQITGRARWRFLILESAESRSGYSISASNVVELQDGSDDTIAKFVDYEPSLADAILIQTIVSKWAPRMRRRLDALGYVT